MNIPVNISGVAPRTVVLLNGMKVVVDAPQDSRWSRGWKRQYGEVWPEDRRKDLTYEVDRGEYEKIKTISHAWEYPNTFDFPDPGLNPVTDYSIIFGPSFVLRDANNTAPQKQQVVHLCPGSEIRLARPVSKRQVRIQLDMPDVRLQDLVEAGRQ